MLDERKSWIMVRRCDVAAAVAWLVFGVLSSLTVLLDPRWLPWCVGMVGLASVLTLIAWLDRRLSVTDESAFEKGLRAAASGLIDLRGHDRV